MSFIVENFSTITQNPTQISNLKDLVLEFAIQGKLVPQNANDEPASSLLKKILEEKKQYLGKSETKSNSSKETSFELPSSWLWSTLGSLSLNIHYGYTAKAHKEIKDTRFLRITDIQNNEVQWDTVPGVEIEKKDRSKYLLKKDDILIARTGGTIGKSYLVKEIPVQSVFASYLIRVIPTTSIDASYVKLFLESPFYWKQLQGKTTGTGQPNVNATSLKALNIPVPPIQEQHRIVQKVTALFQQIDRLADTSERAEAVRGRLRRVWLRGLEEASTPLEAARAWRPLQDHFDLAIRTVEDVRALRGTILQLAVRGRLVPQDAGEEPASVLLERIKEEKARLVEAGEIRKERALPAVSGEEAPFVVPEGWVWCRLNELGCFTGGGTPSRNKSKYWDGDILWVTPKDMKAAIISDSELKITTAGVENSSAKLIPKNSILIVARSGILKRLLPVGINAVKCTVNQDIKVIIPYNGEMSRYIQLMLKGYESYILKNLVKGGTTVQSLKYDQFQAHPFPIPPLSEQRRIVAKVGQLLTWCDELENQIREKEEKEATLVRAALNTTDQSTI